MKTASALLSLALGSMLLPATVGASTLVASYEFNQTLNADQGGVPALTPTDPLAQSGFVVDPTLGAGHYVYRFSGNRSPVTDQAGLSLNTTGLVPTNSYSVEVAVNFDSHGGAWDRLIDVSDRQTDNGLYVDPSNHLQVYPIIAGTDPYTDGYRDVILTVAAGGTVKGYLDGVL